MTNNTTKLSFFEREEAHYKSSVHLFILLGLILALGLIVRLWGLGNVGLHGDEETTAMPAIEILKPGVFPATPGRNPLARTSPADRLPE